MLLKKKTLVKKGPVPRVKSHVLITKGKGDNKEIIKEKGTLLETLDKTQPMNSLEAGKAIVGLAKGITKNLGNFESARIDCWMVKTCDDDEKNCMDTLAEISNSLLEHLEFEVESLDLDESNK